MKKIVLFLVFVLFAALQLNDPDPLLWVTIYTVVALFSLLSLLAPQVQLNKFISVYQALLLLYSLFYIPSFIEYLTQADKMELVGQMKAESPWVEGTRELLGLLIAAVALHFLKTSATDRSDRVE